MLNINDLVEVVEINNNSLINISKIIYREDMFIFTQSIYNYYTKYTYYDVFEKNTLSNLNITRNTFKDIEYLELGNKNKIDYNNISYGSEYIENIIYKRTFDSTFRDILNERYIEPICIEYVNLYKICPLSLKSKLFFSLR